MSETYAEQLNRIGRWKSLSPAFKKRYFQEYLNQELTHSSEESAPYPYENSFDMALDVWHRRSISNKKGYLRKTYRIPESRLTNRI